VVDLGRGAHSDFAAAADRIPGAFVVVRHEYMFAPDHIHRSVKYELARQYGAAGFLIAGPSVVAGSSGEGGQTTSSPQALMKRVPERLLRQGKPECT